MPKQPIHRLSPLRLILKDAAKKTSQGIHLSLCRASISRLDEGRQVRISTIPPSSFIVGLMTGVYRANLTNSVWQGRDGEIGSIVVVDRGLGGSIVIEPGFSSLLPSLPPILGWFA